MPKIRQHVNPLKSDLLAIPEVPRIAPPPGGFLEVELGSAEGEFLIERARAAPGALLVGVEIRREMVVRAERAAREAGLSRIRCVFANMSVDLPRLFAPGTVRRFHLNFPDPWWKSRQKKRRVVSRDLVEHLSGALGPGGEVHVMTDVFEIALEGMAALESEVPRRFENARAPWSFLAENPWLARSRRERQCGQDGRRVWRLWYRKTQPATAT